MKIENRAIEACIQYDLWKHKLQEKTKEIGKHLQACESRQYDKVREQGDLTSAVKVNPCLNYIGDSVYYNCKNCKKAHELIQERKKIRKKLGTAKTKIRFVARKVNKEAKRLRKASDSK